MYYTAPWYNETRLITETPMFCRIHLLRVPMSWSLYESWSVKQRQRLSSLKSTWMIRKSRWVRSDRLFCNPLWHMSRKPRFQIQLLKIVLYVMGCKRNEKKRKINHVSQIKLSNTTIFVASVCLVKVTYLMIINIYFLKFITLLS